MKRVKVEVRSVLRIGCAHNKGGPQIYTWSKFRIFRTFSEFKLWFHEHIANQNSVRFSVSVIFYKFRSSKCKQTVCLNYGHDFHFNIKEINLQRSPILPRADQYADYGSYQCELCQ